LNFHAANINETTAADCMEKPTEKRSVKMVVALPYSYIKTSRLFSGKKIYNEQQQQKQQQHNSMIVQMENPSQ